MGKVVAALLAAALLLVGSAGCAARGAEPGVPKGAVLVLDFTPNAAHAGVYAAQHQHRALRQIGRAHV